MATNIIERLLVEVGLDFSKFSADADKAISKNNKLGESLEGTEEASKKAGEASKELSKEQSKSAKEAAQLGKSIASATKALTTMFSTILISVGMNRLVDQVAKANDELNFLQKNLGMNAKSIKAWQGAAMASGGTAEGMTASLMGLKESMNGLVMFGDTSMLPYFNALGVSMVDNYGKVRKLDDVMLDLSDSLSKMPRDQAYTLGKQMGLDDGTLNTLMMGRKELQSMLDIQKQMYRAGEKELQASREFNKQRAVLNMHWESMKTMIGDMLIPVLTKLIKSVVEFFEYVQRHRSAVEKFFKGLAMVLGVLIIPMFKAALTAALAFFAPFSPFILVVAALAAAFLGLYDDYKTWAEGGNSLFDWGRFKNEIEAVSNAVDKLKVALDFVFESMKKVLNGDFSGAGEVGNVFIRGANKLLNNPKAAVTEIFSAPPKKGLPVSRGGSYANVGAGGGYGAGGDFKDGTLNLSKQDVIDIIKVASTEVVPSLKGKNLKDQTAGVVDTILNRASLNNGDIRKVVNKRWAFSAINSNLSGAYGSVQNMPSSAIKKSVEEAVIEHLKARSGGMESSVDGNTHYANPYYLQNASEATKRWVAEVDSQSKQTGFRYGSGKAIHVHGTPTGERRAPRFKVTLPDEGSPNSISMGAERAQQMVSQGQQMQQVGATQNDNRKYTDVKIGDINIQTSADTIGGNVNDAMKSVNGYMNQLGTSMS